MTNPPDIGVLIVEDEALVSEIIRRALETTGYRVTGSAADGAEAMQMAAEAHPDVVIMDIDLPDVNGLEVARRLQAAAPLAVVVLTAHETPELVERAGAVGVGAYLTKPPNARELDRAIRISLARFADVQALRREKAALEAVSQPRLLLVDDDELARATYLPPLRYAGYDAVAVDSAEAALQKLAEWPAELVVADIMLGGMSGVDLLKVIREQPRDCEVILITGNADVEMAVQAMHAGAFDYLIKPIQKPRLLEAVARAREALRQRWKVRAETEPGNPPAVPLPPEAGADPQAVYHVGAVAVDPARLAISVGGQRVETTPTETHLLIYLCRHPDRVLTPQEMVREVRGLALEAAEAAELIRPHVNSLRRKLLAGSPEADVIETVRSAGYRLKIPPHR